ncbi:hypothetical protein [Streptomyces sp. NPDC088733]|uniref:hypothetical protein n=1 Tax=Streptomyces sp. NPDC088733 TaxID=3365880 RepID=UPI00382633AC
MVRRTRTADAFTRVAQKSVQQDTASWRLATVTATYTDGTIDISTAHGPVAKVRRMKSYTSPAVNDLVVVLTNADGNWVVVGALATS